VLHSPDVQDRAANVRVLVDRSVVDSPNTKAFTMTFASRTTAAAFASLFLMGAAFAQTPAPAAADKSAPAAKMDAPKAKPEMTAESKECSAQADAKGLHGKERKKFRSECKHDAKAGDKAGESKAGDSKSK
jgi:hypothetical protein